MGNDIISHFFIPTCTNAEVGKIFLLLQEILL